MTPQLRRSYTLCERVARTQAVNFYHAFRLLPRRQYFSLCALYAFLRHADDLADGPGDAEQKRAALEGYRQQLQLAYRDGSDHPLLPAYADAVRTHHVPPIYAEEALRGVSMDFEAKSYETFEDLKKYCYRVASVVGLSCVHIWGFRDPQALVHAEAAGIAFQLTNILRDLGEDATQGRTYLPRADLERFGYSVADLSRQDRGDRFQALMRFQADRARDYYNAANALAPLLEAPGRAVFLVMLRTYRGLLDRIEASGFDVFRRRVRVSHWFKLWQVMRALPVRYGVL